MNVLTDTFRGLVRRRLWPVALLLLAALAAVPMLLAKDPPPAPVAAAAVTGAIAAPQTALVSAGDDAHSGHRRYVLGARKDPFAPAPLPKAKKHKKKKAQTTAAAPATPAPSGGSGPSSGSASSGGSGSSGGAPPVSSVPVPAPKPTYPANSLTVRFGMTSGTPTKRTLQRDHALPSANHPVLVYMGLENRGRTAVFMVGADVTKLQGDGRCTPDATSCDTLRLKAGETEFIDVGSTQYELDLEQIHASKSTRAKAASAHIARRAQRPHAHF